MDNENGQMVVDVAKKNYNGCREMVCLVFANISANQMAKKLNSASADQRFFLQLNFFFFKLLLSFASLPHSFHL